MAKKKWKFTDLSDDVEEEKNQTEVFKDDISISNLNSIKKEHSNIESTVVTQKLSFADDLKSNKIISEQKKDEKIIEDKPKNIVKENIFNKNNDSLKTSESTTVIKKEKEYKKDIDEKIKIEHPASFDSKYDIDIDYDSDVPIKQQIQEQQQKKMYTFNETVQMQKESVPLKQEYAFDNNKVKQFISTKEKLDIKTNIYLKPNLVNKIKALSDETGESRSSIINKLIEHAIKDIENNR